ncbi:hypothetical protein T05_1593 [Trichinella murrelli]|uniref:Uncharacterized protein n=1 Tax=Trichinella murrelli TaxID=144512 RepID=A0A0V0T846_9BILA|nr:hypothetical protein T05_1593 [Trichinella murrelli]
MDVKAFPSRPSVPFLITNSIVHHCGLRHPMKLVPFATRVRMDVKAFPSRPSVPLLITAMNNGLRLQKSCLVAADGTQIAFLTVLMFSVTQVRNCEDESRILNDLHRITYYAAVIRL